VGVKGRLFTETTVNSVQALAKPALAFGQLSAMISGSRWGKIPAQRIDFLIYGIS
jgi:hypothetical protein